MTVEVVIVEVVIVVADMPRQTPTAAERVTGVTCAGRVTRDRPSFVYPGIAHACRFPLRRSHVRLWRVQVLAPPALWSLLSAIADARTAGDPIPLDAEQLVSRLFATEGRSLVRLARLFVDDRDAAEDIVQESFLRLARHAGRIADLDRAPAYLRSIVLNLARDHNRRGLVSLRHQASAGREIEVVDDPASELTDRLVRDAEHGRVLECVRRLPRRQRDCLTLRYFEEYSLDEIAATLGVSHNSVKTHLQRGLDNLGRALAGSVKVGR